MALDALPAAKEVDRHTVQVAICDTEAMTAEAECKADFPQSRKVVELITCRPPASRPR